MDKADRVCHATSTFDRKPLIATSREAVQTAEDARAIAVKKMDDVRLANERQASADDAGANARTSR